MRPRFLALLVFAACAVAAAPARAADVEPMLIPGSGPGPILADGSAVWASRTDRRVTVRSRPVAGGTARVIARTRVGPDRDDIDEIALTGATGTGVLLAYRDKYQDERTLYGPPSGPLGPVQVLAAPGVVESLRFLLPTQAGILRLPDFMSGSRWGVLTQPPGGYRVLEFPREVSAVSTGGQFVAWKTAAKQIVVLDLRSGEVQRVIAAPRRPVTNFAVGPDGSVAAVTGSNETSFAGPTAEAFTVLRRGAAVTKLALDGERIAQATVNGRRPAVRVEVFDVKEPQRTLSRGPVISNPRDLALEDDAVTYRAIGCGIVANAAGGDTGRLVPAGPCVRTQFSLGTIRAKRDSRDRSVVTVPVRCLDGPGGRCRVRATINLQSYFSGSPLRRVGTVATTLGTGKSRTLRLSTRGILARRVLAKRYQFRAYVRVTDPDGKTWVQDDWADQP